MWSVVSELKAAQPFLIVRQRAQTFAHDALLLLHHRDESADLAGHGVSCAGGELVDAAVFEAHLESRDVRRDPLHGLIERLGDDLEPLDPLSQIVTVGRSALIEPIEHAVVDRRVKPTHQSSEEGKSGESGHERSLRSDAHG
ncbi:hypothetical protein FJ658_04990 [Schumannella sp. 10F1B-5-1]|nr:hypothetical protein FJ658_04990 [Schumannella sp. 10F1B-5-1]